MNKHKLTLACAAAVIAAGMLYPEAGGTVKTTTLAEFKKIKQRFAPADISKACNRPFGDRTAGDKKGGWTDQGDNDMREFPTGSQTFLGVPFKILGSGKTCIVLRGQNDLSCPDSVTVPVKRKVKGVYFLHSSAWTKGALLGKYIVNYSDKKSVEIPIENGKNIADWWRPVDLETASVAWRGKNARSSNIGIYIFPWENPYPETEITSISASTPGDNSYIMIAGMTLADSAPYLVSSNEYYREKETAGNPCREQQFAEFREFVKTETARNKRAPAKKEIDKKSTGDPETDLKKILGWPLYPEPEGMTAPECKPELIGEDSLGRIYRMRIKILEGLSTYGILFIPKGKGPHPALIAQHGMDGTPEMTAGFYNSYNYNDMVRRLLKRGVAVFAPQLFTWKTEQLKADLYRKEFDAQLKDLGGSMLAMDLFRIRRILDYLSSRPEIDGERIGMIGLSYGGACTLFTTAIDKRVKTALASCCLNEKYASERVCGLICPRPLWVEAGTRDTIFGIENSRKAAKKMEELYSKRNASKNFRFVEFNGGHELNTDDAGIDSICRYLRKK